MSEVFDYRWVKTRKPHTCFACSREFPKGTIMERQVLNGVPEGIMTIHLCSTCEHLISEKFPDGGEYEEGTFAEEAAAYELT